MRLRTSKDSPKIDGFYHTDIGYIEYRDGLWRNKGVGYVVTVWVEGVHGNWFDASIQKPASNVAVLVYIPSEDEHITSGMIEDDGSWTLLDEYRDVAPELVTHWMPCPDKPTQV